MLGGTVAVYTREVTFVLPSSLQFTPWNSQFWGSDSHIINMNIQSATLHITYGLDLSDFLPGWRGFSQANLCVFF